MTVVLETSRSFVGHAAALTFTLIALVVPSVAQEFPLTIEHKFGTTIIPEKPKRVATVDGNGADNILALGMQPATIEDWYGGYDNGLWPWASPLLETKPVMLASGNLDFESIASAKPDVLLSFYNSVTLKEYEKLSLIAPVVAVPEGRGDWSLTWEERALFTGLATGNEEAAIARVDEIRDRVNKIAENHPDWAGKTAVIGWISGDGRLGSYSSHDTRVLLLEQMGFVTPAGLNALDPDGAVSIYLSAEAIEFLNADLLIWIDGDGDVNPIIDLPSRAFIEPHKDGREVVFTKETTGALSYGSLLSLPYALERMETAIEAALDGDPTTNADDRPDNW